MHEQIEYSIITTTQLNWAFCPNHLGSATWILFRHLLRANGRSSSGPHSFISFWIMDVHVTFGLPLTLVWLRFTVTLCTRAYVLGDQTILSYSLSFSLLLVCPCIVLVWSCIQHLNSEIKPKVQLMTIWLVEHLGYTKELLADIAKVKVIDYDTYVIMFILPKLRTMGGSGLADSFSTPVFYRQTACLILWQHWRVSDDLYSAETCPQRNATKNVHNLDGWPAHTHAFQSLFVRTLSFHW